MSYSELLLWHFLVNGPNLLIILISLVDGWFFVLMMVLPGGFISFFIPAIDFYCPYGLGNSQKMTMLLHYKSYAFMNSGGIIDLIENKVRLHILAELAYTCLFFFFFSGMDLIIAVE